MNLRQGVTNSIICRPFISSIWETLRQLKIANVTRRGYRGGKLRKRLPIKTRISERLCLQTSSRSACLNNLTPIQTVPLVTSADHNKKPKACLGVWNAAYMKAKTPSICDMIIEQKLHLLLITESWLNGDSRDDCAIADLKNTLPQFNFHQRPRLDKKGGGVCILSHKGLVVKHNESHQFRSFEHMDTTISSGHSSFRLVTIYRPPPSKENELTAKIFFEDFSNLLEHVTIYPGRVLLSGDFNVHVDEPFRSGMNLQIVMLLLFSTYLSLLVLNNTCLALHTNMGIHWT